MNSNSRTHGSGADSDGSGGGGGVRSHDRRRRLNARFIRGVAALYKHDRGTRRALDEAAVAWRTSDGLLLNPQPRLRSRATAGLARRVGLTLCTRSAATVVDVEENSWRQLHQAAVAVAVRAAPPRGEDGGGDAPQNDAIHQVSFPEP